MMPNSWFGVNFWQAVDIENLWYSLDAYVTIETREKVP